MKIEDFYRKRLDYESFQKKQISGEYDAHAVLFMTSEIPLLNLLLVKR